MYIHFYISAHAISHAGADTRDGLDWEYDDDRAEAWEVGQEGWEEDEMNVDVGAKQTREEALKDALVAQVTKYLVHMYIYIYTYVYVYIYTYICIQLVNLFESRPSAK